MSIHQLPALADRRYYVYAMLCRDADTQGYIKFGLSSSIGYRLTRLCKDSALPPKLFAIVEFGHRRDIAVKVENALRQMFNLRKVSGEWYKFDFSNPDDKREFNEGSKRVFNALLPGRWWTLIQLSGTGEPHKVRMATWKGPQRLARAVAQMRSALKRNPAEAGLSG